MFHHDRYRSNDSNKNVDIQFGAHDAFLRVAPIE